MLCKRRTFGDNKLQAYKMCMLFFVETSLAEKMTVQGSRLVKALTSISTLYVVIGDRDDSEY